jgi:hypothetical protein
MLDRWPVPVATSHCSLVFQKNSWLLRNTTTVVSGACNQNCLIMIRSEHMRCIPSLAVSGLIGSSVVARVAGRAGVAWIVTGFTGFVAGEVKCSERVAGIIHGSYQTKRIKQGWLLPKSVRKEESSTTQDKKKRKKTNRGENKTNSRLAENIKDQSKTRQDLL